MSHEWLIHCHRCGDNPTDETLDSWNGTYENGYLVAATCGPCQTPLENVEAQVNEAMIDYDIDTAGRVVGRPKI